MEFVPKEKDGRELRLREVLGLCSVRVNTWIAERGLPLFSMERLLSWKPAEAAALMDGVCSLNIGQNLLSETLDLVHILSKKNREAPALILQRAVTQAGGNLSGKNLATGVRDILKEWRYPKLVKKQGEFEEAVTALGAKPGVQILPSAFFEGDYLELRTRLHSREEAVAFADWIKVADWEKIFKVLA